MSVNENMTIADVLKSNPDSVKIFMSYGMHCMGCAIASGETIAQAAQVHNINVKELMEKLNKSGKTDN